MAKIAARSILCSALLLAGVEARAADRPPSATLRGFVAYAVPTGDGTLTVLEVEADPSFGWGCVFEFRRGRRWGLELGVMLLEFDFDVRTLFDEPVDATLGEARVVPVLFGVDLHLLGGRSRPDLYVAPLVSYNLWGNLRSAGGPDASLDGEFGFGAVLGLDVPIGAAGVQFNAALRYLTMGAGNGRGTIDVDPLFLEIGAGYRW